MTDSNKLAINNSSNLQRNDNSYMIKTEANAKAIESICGAANGIISAITTMQNNYIEAEKQIHLMDVQLEAFLADLDLQYKISDEISNNLRMLHNCISKLINAATSIAVEENISESKLKVLLAILNSAHRHLDSIDNALNKL